MFILTEWIWKIKLYNINNGLTKEAVKLAKEAISVHFNEEHSKDPNGNNTDAVLHDICVTKQYLMIEFVVKKEHYSPNIQAFNHIVQRCLDNKKLHYISAGNGRCTNR